MLRVALPLLFVACTRSTPPRVTLAAPSASAQSSASGELLQTLLPPTAIAWQWSGDAPGFGRSFYRAPRTVTEGGVTCTFTYREKAGDATTACASGERDLWRADEGHAFVADAALVIHRGTLYVARFSDIATGCTLSAFDARTGVKRWTRKLAGIGPIGHSEYLNAVELRVVGGRPVAFGWESSGRYIEALDPATGDEAFHAVLAASP